MKEYKRNNFDNKTLHEGAYYNMAMYFPILDHSWDTINKFSFEIRFTIYCNKGLNWLIKCKLHSNQ